MKATTIRQLALTSTMTFGALAAQSKVADARTQCPAPGPSQVTLYQLANYSGSCQVLNLRPDGLPTGYPGYDAAWDFNSGSLAGVYYNWDTLFPRNSISSVKVGTGVYLTLFYYKGYAGDHINFDTGNYPFVGWIDDQTASLRITPTDRDCRKRADGTFQASLRSGEIAIYEDSLYGGDCVQWRSSDPFLPTGYSGSTWKPVLGAIDVMWGAGLFESASASSIRVGPFTAARLCRVVGNYEDPRYSEYYCETFNLDVWRLSNTAFGNDTLNSLTIKKLPVPGRARLPVPVP